jgi:hypothetical protein
MPEMGLGRRPAEAPAQPKVEFAHDRASPCARSSTSSGTISLHRELYIPRYEVDNLFPM